MNYLLPAQRPTDGCGQTVWPERQYSYRMKYSCSQLGPGPETIPQQLKYIIMLGMSQRLLSTLHQPPLQNVAFLDSNHLSARHFLCTYLPWIIHIKVGSEYQTSVWTIPHLFHLDHNWWADQLSQKKKNQADLLKISHMYIIRSFSTSRTSQKSSNQ